MNLNNDYSFLIQKINDCKKQFDFVVYGKSTLNQNLYAFHKGSYNGPQILITAGMHAREYISSFVAIDILKNYQGQTGIYVLPLTNPDGVKLCVMGTSFIKDKNLCDFLKRINCGSEDFSLWKSNIRGVDLNENFDANWKNSRYVKNYPGPNGFYGENANSEKENISIINFVKKHSFCFSIQLHTKGKVVYYGFSKLTQKEQKIQKKLAKSVAKQLKYKIIRSVNSSGGLSDYLYFRKKIPSITVELGSEYLVHPIKFAQLSKINFKVNYENCRFT